MELSSLQGVEASPDRKSFQLNLLCSLLVSYALWASVRMHIVSSTRFLWFGSYPLLAPPTPTWSFFWLTLGMENDEQGCPSTDGSGMEGSGTPTSPQSATGNGVTQVKKIRGVGFGDIFKEGSVKLKARIPSPDVEERKEKVSGTGLCMTNAIY